MGTCSAGLLCVEQTTLIAMRKDQLPMSVGLFELEILWRPQLKTKCSSDCAN